MINKTKTDWIKINNSIFSTSLLLLFIILFAIKIITIYVSYKNLFPLKYCVAHFITDYYYLLIILFFATINLFAENRIIKQITNIINMLLVTVYSIDIFSIYYFQSRESLLWLFSLALATENGWIWFTNKIIFRIVIILVLLLWIYFFVLKTEFNKKITKIISPKIFLLYYLLWIFFYFLQPIIIRNAIPNAKNILFINIETIKKVQESKIPIFTDKKFEDYIKYESGDGKDLNVILVFYESLSAIDSAHLWWNNNTPWLDKIQEDGITYTNYISNWVGSHHAHVGVLLWIPPIKENYGYYFSHFSPLWLAGFLNKQWYLTTFISTAPLTFFDQKSFLSWVWFQKIIGEEEFKDYKTYTFDSAADEELYKRTLQELQIQTWKYFIGIQTISFHEPYDTPLWKTEKLALQYSDEQLYNFYQQLQKIWFFDNWLLIIVWDHRKRTHVEKWEFNIFWPARKYKSIATIIWTWIINWSINNNLVQQTDFYYSIKKLLWYWDIEMNIFYNDVFSSTVNRDWWIMDNASIWDPTDDTTFLFKNWNQYDIDYNHNNKDAYDYYLFLKSVFLKNNILSENL